MLLLAWDLEHLNSKWAARPMEGGKEVGDWSKIPFAPLK